jgi:prepilin-type N-terminal cleavage/methylation domain-containing protein
MQGSAARGYTLIETIVALLVFSVGGLALASTASLIGRQLNVDDLRERAARVAVGRLEVLRAGCRGAASGSELIQGVQSLWSVAAGDSSRIGVVESVSYPSSNGRRTDTYRLLIDCQ